MALQPLDLYAYEDLQGNQVRVKGVQLTERGAWSSLATYSSQHVVEFQTALYIALVTNTNVAPSGITNSTWSVLVVVQPGTPPILPYTVTADGAVLPVS